MICRVFFYSFNLILFFSGIFCLLVGELSPFELQKVIHRLGFIASTKWVILDVGLFFFYFVECRKVCLFCFMFMYFLQPFFPSCLSLYNYNFVVHCALITLSFIFCTFITSICFLVTMVPKGKHLLVVLTYLKTAIGMHKSLHVHFPSNFLSWTLQFISLHNVIYSQVIIGIFMFYF